MRKRASAYLLLGGVIALQALFQALLPIASLASDGTDPGEPARQEGEDRWVPSLAITAGANFQEQQGSALSWFDSNQDGSPSPGEMPIRCVTDEPGAEDALGCTVEGDDLGVAPFVGASLELMTPALPIPTRPRLFLSGEILPTFSPDHNVAVEGDTDCFKGPEPDAVCATKEMDPEEGDYYLKREKAFAQGSANGVGSTTTSWIDTLVFGAKLGVAWPFRIGERQLRIKPSVGWIYYEVEAKGLVIGGSCNPASRCTPVITPDGTTVSWGYFRERILTARGSQKFHGIGPGLDLEMDTGRFGPIGSSIFLGGGAYHVLGDRSFSFGTEVDQPDVLRDSFYPDPLYATDPVAIGPEDRNAAQFGVEVDPWMFRAHVGIRFQWLGSRK